MTDWNEVHITLEQVLGLRNNPIAITFSDTIPAKVPHFESTYPISLEDGRTGAVSAGCEFWIHAVNKTFYTMEQDHENCSVGSVTHGFKNWEDVFNNSDVGTILECEWVSESDVAKIATKKEKPKAIIYGPLNETPVNPDVIFIRINGEQLMTLKDTFPDLTLEGKPQCHIIPMADGNGNSVVASTGCALSRIRTGMSSNEISAVISAKSINDTLSQLQKTRSINKMVGDYAKQDKQRF